METYWLVSNAAKPLIQTEENCLRGKEAYSLKWDYQAIITFMNHCLCNTLCSTVVFNTETYS